MPFGIRRFRAFTPHGVWQVVFSHPFEIRHFYSIVGFRPIVWIESSFSDIWLQKTLKVAVIYCCTARFSPSRQPVSWVLWPLLTSHDKLYSVMVHRIHHLHHASVRPPRIRALSFHLIPTSFTPTVPNSYRALVCSATLPTVICLVWSFCSLSQMFAASFLQISPYDGHPCSWLYNSRY